MRVIKYERENGTIGLKSINDEPSKTDQQYKDDCDVNEIIRRYKKDGIVPHVKNINAQFADVSDIPSLMEGIERIDAAKEEWLKVPASIRKKHGNSVVNFYNWLADPANQDEAVKLGLKKKPKPAEEPVAAPKAAEGGKNGGTSTDS